MELRKVLCEKCGKEIGVNNYNRHIQKCDDSGIKPSRREKEIKAYKIDHDGLECKFCGKSFNNKNALVQHEIRCPENKNRKAYNNLAQYTIDNVKGKTADNCEQIKKQKDTIKKKYDSGYVNPCKGRKVQFEYVYKEHNDLQIDKWREYLKSVIITVQPYETISHPEGYKMISCSQNRLGNTIKYVFEHDYIMNLYLGGTLLNENTVHHIDKDRTNNNIMNLMTFNTNGDHKRFHNSKYAFLVYDEKTHKFNCVLRKD